MHPKWGGPIFFSLNFGSDYRKFRLKNMPPPLRVHVSGVTLILDIYGACCGLQVLPLEILQRLRRDTCIFLDIFGSLRWTTLIYP